MAQLVLKTDASSKNRAQEGEYNKQPAKRATHIHPAEDVARQVNQSYLSWKYNKFTIGLGIKPLETTSYDQNLQDVVI